MDALLKTLIENPGPIEQSAFIVAIAIVLSVILRFAFEAILAHFSHRQDRRSYEYERSATVNKMRFERELDSLQVLAKIFMQLRIQTHLIRTCDKGQLDQVVFAWDALYDEAVISLGEAAPVLNLRDIAHGGPTCGVHSKGFCFSRGRDHGKTVRCKPSLYLRGIAFLDQAIVSRCTALVIRGNAVPSRIPLFLYVDEESDGFGVDIESDLFSRAPLAQFESRSIATGKESAGETVPEAQIQPEVDKDLDDAYKRFVNCSFCRLRNSDTGQKDARKINRKNARRKRWVERFGFLSKYDRTCPFEEDGPS